MRSSAECIEVKNGYGCASVQTGLKGAQVLGYGGLWLEMLSDLAHHGNQCWSSSHI